MKLICYILFWIGPISTGAQRVPPQLANLLAMATNYRQVERCTNLIPYSELIMDIPCISPLYADDFRHLYISSYYGQRLHPILNEYKHHSGIDLPGHTGDNVYATANGVVKKVNQDPTIGKFVRIRHKYGFDTIYGHLSAQKVQYGDSVRIGNVIGIVGSTGRSTGPHLHYGITKNNIQQDPLPYCYLYMKWIKRNKTH